MRTIVKYDGARIPESSLLWLSRKFRQSVPQVIDDLGLDLADYAGEDAGPSPEEIAARDAADAAEEEAAQEAIAARAAADAAEEEAAAEEAQAVEAARAEEAKTGEPAAARARRRPDYQKAVGRIVEKYAAEKLPASSLNWITKTFRIHPRVLFDDLLRQAQRTGKAPPSGGVAPPVVGSSYRYQSGGRQTPWNWGHTRSGGYVGGVWRDGPITPIRRARAKPSLKKRKRQRERFQKTETGKGKVDPGTGSIQFFHWGGVKKPQKYTVAGKFKVQSIRYPGKDPWKNRKCFAHHPYTAFVKAGKVGYRVGWGSFGTYRETRVRKGQCLALGIGAYDPDKDKPGFQAGLDSAAGVGTHVVKTPKPSPPVGSSSSRSTSGGSMASMQRMQQISQEMMAAASRGDVARQRQLLAEMMKLADDPRMPPSQRAMFQQLRATMGGLGGR